ncbi:MAG TPA: DUF4430 domain-containing protein [Candidatus Saccharimonadales bacterium]|nr:DUF4430 domain-containing protein [Candidatus Saccharimonadales bacterium]
MPRTKKPKTTKKITAKPVKTQRASLSFLSGNRAAFYFVCAIVLGFGIYLFIPALSSHKATATQVQPSDIVALDGQDNVTALNLLKASHQVQTEQTSLGEYITGIDGVTPNSNQFWAFYVNGQMADVGADSYVTKSTDRIVFSLQNLN